MYNNQNSVTLAQKTHTQINGVDLRAQKEIILILTTNLGHGRRKWQPSPAFLPGKYHGQRSLAGYSPRDRKELDTTKQLHFQSWDKLKIIFTSIFIVKVLCFPKMHWNASLPN